MADPPDPALDEIRRLFESFETSFADLELYGRLAAGCAADPEVAGLLLAARPGQGRPVLLFAAVHDLVLRRPELDLARWYSSVTPRDARARGDAWPTFRATCLSHRDELEAVIATHGTQTNEVNRAVLLAVLLGAAYADRPRQPVSFVELGASAGLLSAFERYRIAVGEVVVGDAASPVALAGDVRGDRRPDLSVYPRSVAEWVGIDIDPVRLDDADRVRWLEACLWPDQPWRIDRFRAAVALVRAAPPRLVAGDFVDSLDEVVATLDPANHLVVFDAWAVTYVARERREEIAAVLARLAAKRRAVTWLSAEPPGCIPDIDAPPWNDPNATTRPDTVLGIRRWRDRVEAAPETLGWAHPHGNWLALT